MNKSITKLFLLLFAFLVPASGWAQDTTYSPDGGLTTYTWDTDHWVFQKFDVDRYKNGSVVMTALYIDEKINDNNGHEGFVTAIADNAMVNLTVDVQREMDVQIPSKIESIGENAFSGSTAIKNVFFNCSLSIPIADNAFNGIGTATEPLLVRCDNWDDGMQQAFFKYVTGLVKWTDGVGDWKGAKIRTQNSIQEPFSGGYQWVYTLNGCAVEEEGLWFKVVSAKKVTENLPEWFEGVYVFDITNSWSIDGGMEEIPVKAVKDGAFEGIGTAEAPVALEATPRFFKSLGGTFSNGIAQLGGGNFQMIITRTNDNITTTYAYNETDGEGEYIALTTAKAEWAPEDFTDYILYVRDQIYIWDSQTQTGSNVPVRTYKSGYAEGVKDIIKRVGFEIYDYVPTLEDGALTGIGTAEAPMDLDTEVKTFKSLGGTFSNGIAQLAGGNFQIVRTQESNRIVVTYVYNEDAEGNVEYIATKAEKSPYVSESYTNFQLHINGTIYEWDNEAQTDVYYPVTTVKAGFAEGVKDIIKKVRFNIEEKVPTFEDGALAGIGTATAPMYAQAWYPYGLVKSLNLEAQDGVYNIGGGYVQFTRENNYVYYALNGEEYIATGYNAESIQNDILNGYTPTISLSQYFYEEWYENGEYQRKQIYVTSVKDGAFEGLGTAEAPIECSTNPTTFQKLGGDLSTGTLASGYFKLSRNAYAGDGFEYAKYELINGAYVLTQPIKAYSGNSNYELRLYSQFEDWDAEAQKSIITPVSAFKKSAFDEIRDVNITQLTINGTNATEIEAGAFEGFGATNPIVLSMNAKALKALGGTFGADGVSDLASGKFIVGRSENNNGIKIIYAYGEDADGNGLYTVYKGEKLDWGDDYSYGIYIRNYFYEWDEATQTDNYYYVKGIAANAFGDDVKSVVKKVQLEASQMTSVDASAFSGIGTADAPIDINGNIALISKLGTIGDAGLITLGGGNFQYIYTYTSNGITVKGKLASNLNDVNSTEKMAELTVVGYEQNSGYSNPLLYIPGGTGYSAGEGDDYVYVTMRTTKIAPNAFEGIQNVTGVTIDGTYLQEIGESAFTGIGAEGANVPLSISPILANRFKNQMEGSKLAGGYFDIARIQQFNGLRYIYLYVDGAYELSKVEELYNYDSYTAYIYTGFEDYSEDPVEWTDIEGNPRNSRYPQTYVTEIKADALAAVANKITSVTISDNFNNTKMEVEDGAFTGIGSIEKGASFMAKTTQTQRLIGDKVADGIYDIKGGFFAMKAITIKAQKNPNGLAFAITNAEGRDENYNYAQLINWNTELSPEMMKAPAEGDDYYTYTFLGANTITYLRIYNVKETEVDGQIRRDYYNEAYRNRQELTIDRDTTFIWSAEKGRLLLEGAPMEYDIYVAGQMVTEANAADILAYDPNNAGKAKYDSETKTLTLDGININYSGSYTLNNEGVDGLKIVVKGDNTFSGSWPLSRFYTKTTIEGDGTLNFNYLNGANDGDCRIDIYSDVTIKDITLNSTGAYYGFRGSGTLTVENAIINVEEVASQYGYAMMLGDLILNGAQILAPEGAVFKDGDNGRGVYDAEGKLAKSLYIGAPAAFTVTVEVQNLDEEKTEKATLTVENSGAVSGIALPADMANANFSIVLPDKVTSPDGVEVAINAVAANAFAGKNLKQITLPLNNGFVNIGAGAVNADTKILAPVGYLKNYKELASIADNVTGELLAGYVVTDKSLVTIGVEVTVRADANAKYYQAVYNDDNTAIVGQVYEGELIPEITGLLVETTDDVEGIELVVVDAYADNTEFMHNLLCPVFTDTDLSNEDGNYILVDDEFQRAKTMENPTVKAGAAYLYDATSSADILKVDLTGTATGVKEISVDDENAEWYNINGQRVNKPVRRGVYIKNGKKVTVK